MKSSILLITGPPKTGKSRFINELLGQDVLYSHELKTLIRYELIPGTRLDYVLQDSLNSVDRKQNDVLSGTGYQNLVDELSAQSDEQLYSVQVRVPFLGRWEGIREVPAAILTLDELNEVERIVLTLPTYGIDAHIDGDVSHILQLLQKYSGKIVLTATCRPGRGNMDSVYKLVERYMRSRINLSRLKVSTIPWEEAIHEHCK